jgi:serine/threonine-protein kinase
VTTDPRIGTNLVGHRIEALLGRGGMGVVYRAEHLGLGRKVALKILAPELAKSEGFRRRFIRESQTAASMEHPNIVPIYDAGEAEDLLYISMRYVEGPDLSALLEQEGRIDPERAIAITFQVAGALDAAHRRGLVHRDVKPANILIAQGWGPGSSEHCYLCDFGLIKHFESQQDLTQTGQFVGTIPYVAPEQIEGRPLDGRADLYALACVLFHCLTGGAPFERETDVAVVYAHLQDPPPPVGATCQDLPPALDAVFAKGMAKSPDDRFATCTELVRAARTTLQARLRTQPGTAPTASLPEGEPGAADAAATPAPRPLTLPLGAGADPPGPSADDTIVTRPGRRPGPQQEADPAPWPGVSRGTRPPPARALRPPAPAPEALARGPGPAAPTSRASAPGRRPAAPARGPGSVAPARSPAARRPRGQARRVLVPLLWLLALVTVGVGLGAAAFRFAGADRTGSVLPPAGTDSPRAPASSAPLGPDVAQPGSAGGAATSTCVRGWTTPAAGTATRRQPLDVIRKEMGIAGEFKVVEMRYFREPGGGRRWWYVKAWQVDDRSLQARWLVERAPDGSARIAAVAPYSSKGLRSPQWQAFEGEGDARSYTGLPGAWRGTPHDFAAGGAVPSQVRGCLAGT